MLRLYFGLFLIIIIDLIVYTMFSYTLLNPLNLCVLNLKR